MRILLVHTYYAPEIYGGAEYSVKKLAEALCKEGHEVRILCSGEKNLDEIINGVQVHRVRCKGVLRASDVEKAPRWKRLMNHLVSIWNIRNEKILRDFILDFNPDIIHTNCLYEISPIIWKVAKKNSAKLVHTLRDYHLMCPLVAMSCKKTEGKNCTHPPIQCRLHRNINRIHSKYVDCVTAPSACTLHVLIYDGFFKKSQKIVIPNAIDFHVDNVQKILETRKGEIFSKEKISFVYLGTLSEQKGIKWMLEAFQKLESNEAELVIAGKGILEGIVKKASVDDHRIQYIGFLSEVQVSALLKKCDVLICPSLWEEPFGRVVLDAYKNAMPVISSDRGALPELVKDQKTGLVVKASDTSALTRAIRFFVENRRLLLDYGENALEELEEYSIDSQVNAFLEIYSKETK